LGAVSSRPFKSLGDLWPDTTTPHGRLMLMVLSGIAAFERDPILQRTSEGRIRAMAEGTRFGGKPKLTKHQEREALKRVAAGEPLRKIALSYRSLDDLSAQGSARCRGSF
jgi:DNA invertase Pin-like site-specific DNA recombinase